jgi:murein DD-endopeptidase MepM/ murein hydrolase activator NlpD
LKRTFTQKVKKVPTCAADSFDALLKLYVGYLGKHPVGATIPTDANNRRARTSAAMIGLAISMGAAGLMLPRHGDEAMALEPVAAEPTLPNLPTAPEASISSASVMQPQVMATATPLVSVKAETPQELKPASIPVVEHQVKKGETLWELSKAYEIQPEAIAASNNINPNGVLPIGQTLKIPAVNGIVHQVKPGDTVETLSESYGVEPTQLQASARVSELGQLKTGESVTVPGNVNDLLKARQDVALKRLKEQGNRLNDSLAELRSEESTQSSELAKVPTESVTESGNSVTLPPAVLKTQEPFATPQPVATALPTPVVIPVPTPEMAASPTVTPKATPSPESAGIPVPTPEMAASPTVTPKVTKSPESFVIPVPTPEMAASPTVTPKVTKSPESFVIPVPTPEIAASPTVTRKVPTVPNLSTAPSSTVEPAAKPEAPQPVIIEPLGAASTANVYKVKPGDTLDAIARRNGLSRAALMQANGLNNPHLLRIDQPLKIPQTKPASTGSSTVALLPGIDSKPDRSAPGQAQQRVKVPAPVVPTLPEPVVPVVSTGQSQPSSRSLLADSSNADRAKPNSTVAADNKPKTEGVGNSQSNVYVEKLKADILRLQEEYRQNGQRTQATASSNIVVPAVSAPAAPNSSNTSRINPEFKPNNDNLQASRSKRSQAAQPSSIPIEVPPPESQKLVATSPAPTGNYNRDVSTPIGETVAPEVPSLSAPDMYLPNGSTKFNGYIWPTKGVLTSGYGWRWGRMHKGIDIAAPVGTPVVAAAPGVVVTAGWNSGGYGNLVEIQHPDGSLTLYAHNNRILVRRGQAVEQGQQISEMGSTGYSTGPHCHFEVHPTGNGAVNPIAYLPPRRG